MRHPIQPLGLDRAGVLRFKENAIVAWLAEGRLNEIARMEQFSDEDRCQLAQLIGYSLAGYGDLPYVSDEEYERSKQQQPEAKQSDVLTRQHVFIASDRVCDYCGKLCWGTCEGQRADAFKAQS